jgi:hypothetical protein
MIFEFFKKSDLLSLPVLHLSKKKACRCIEDPHAIVLQLSYLLLIFTFTVTSCAE